ncbi:MAG: hypothetical protein ACXIVQ_12165 [Acidimicrobiales bacterium]
MENFDGQRSLDDWLHDPVTVVDPLASVFRIRSTHRYDIVANMAKALRVVEREPTDTTEIFLYKLYDTITQVWTYGNHTADRERARDILRISLDPFHEGHITDLIEDFGWQNNLKITTTPALMSAHLRRAFVARLARDVEKLLRRCKNVTEAANTA